MDLGHLNNQLGPGQEIIDRVILAGDLNILRGCGEWSNEYWKKRYATVFDRLEALGLKFIGPKYTEGGRQVESWPLDKPRELPKDNDSVPSYYGKKRNPDNSTSDHLPAEALRQYGLVFASKSITD